MHICCAPCAIYPLKVLRSEGFQVMGFFYNRNIHPFEECQRRQNALKAYAEQADLDAWNHVLAVNLTAVFRISQAFCRHRKQVGEPGKIINIGSLMCHGARPTNTAYACSKGGVLMLTKSLAVEWAKYRINVNAVGPGYIATDLTAPLRQDKKLNDWVLSSTPLRRWGQPEDLIGAGVFLASAAGDFVTGQILYVDGGWLSAL